MTDLTVRTACSPDPYGLCWRVQLWAVTLTSQAVVKPNELGLSRERVIEAIGKPVLEDRSYSISPDKLVPGLHLGDSRGGCTNPSS